jgi:ABC-type multidrug transport system permease subunit
MAAAPQTLVPYALALFLVAFTGGILGLIVSAMSNQGTTKTNWLLLLTIPQLILSGVMIPSENISFPLNILAGMNPSRYALDALLISSGYKEGISAIPASHWLAFVIISLGLIVFLVGIQRRAEKARI